MSVPSSDELAAIVAALALATPEPAPAPDSASAWSYAARRPELEFDDLRAALRSGLPRAG